MMMRWHRAYWQKHVSYQWPQAKATWFRSFSKGMLMTFVFLHCPSSTLNCMKVQFSRFPLQFLNEYRWIRTPLLSLFFTWFSAQCEYWGWMRVAVWVTAAQADWEHTAVVQTPAESRWSRTRTRPSSDLLLTEPGKGVRMLFRWKHFMNLWCPQSQFCPCNTQMYFCKKWSENVFRQFFFFFF